MDTIDAIRERFGFDLPELYRTLLAQGRFSTSPWENYLEMADCEWLSLEDIAAYEFLDFQITSAGGFVPFAISARRDEYCWRMDWRTGAEAPVVFCERGESGFGYAPDFAGFLFRKTLEEFAGLGGVEREPDLKRLRHVVEIVAPVLPGPWGRELTRLAALEFSEWKIGKFGEPYVLAKKDLSAEIARQLTFAHLDERFELES